MPRLLKMIKNALARAHLLIVPCFFHKTVNRLLFILFNIKNEQTKTTKTNEKSILCEIETTVRQFYSKFY